MKKKSILFALAAVCLPVVLSAQQERKITLNEAIAMARVQSVDAAVALNELKTAYWEYRTFRADLLPEVNLTGTLPNYNKSYGSYQNADGSYSFVRNSQTFIRYDNFYRYQYSKNGKYHCCDPY